MATAATLCSICQEETGTFICTGCSKSFCFEHLTEHRQLLNEQFHPIQDEFNQFRQIIIDIKNTHQNHPLVEEINQWEINSINQIKQKAKECRQRLINYTNQIIDQIEMKLNETNQQFISNNKKKNDFNEIHLNQLKDKLEILKEELNQPKDISIIQQSNSFIQEISIQFRCSKFYLFDFKDYLLSRIKFHSIFHLESTFYSKFISVLFQIFKPSEYHFF
jgi:hypothetical protein